MHFGDIIGKRFFKTRRTRRVAVPFVSHDLLLGHSRLDLPGEPVPDPGLELGAFVPGFLVFLLIIVFRLLSLAAKLFKDHAEQDL